MITKKEISIDVPIENHGLDFVPLTLQERKDPANLPDCLKINATARDISNCKYQDYLKPFKNKNCERVAQCWGRFNSLQEIAKNFTTVVRIPGYFASKGSYTRLQKLKDYIKDHPSVPIVVRGNLIREYRKRMQIEKKILEERQQELDSQVIQNYKGKKVRLAEPPEKINALTPKPSPQPIVPVKKINGTEEDSTIVRHNKKIMTLEELKVLLSDEGRKYGNEAYTIKERTEARFALELLIRVSGWDKEAKSDADPVIINIIGQPLNEENKEKIAQPVKNPLISYKKSDSSSDEDFIKIVSDVGREA